MKIAIQAFILLLALWSAHVAGAAYVLGKDKPGVPLGGILRTIIAVLLAATVLFVEWAGDRGFSE